MMAVPKPPYLKDCIRMNALLWHCAFIATLHTGWSAWECPGVVPQSSRVRLLALWHWREHTNAESAISRAMGGHSGGSYTYNVSWQGQLGCIQDIPKSKLWTFSCIYEPWIQAMPHCKRGTNHKRKVQESIRPFLWTRSRILVFTVNSITLWRCPTSSHL